MATHSSILAWRIPWNEEPGVLQSMVLHSQTQVRNFHSQVDLALERNATIIITQPNLDLLIHMH